MQLVDHVIVLLLFVVQPIHGAFEFRYYSDRAKAGQPAERVRIYRQIAFTEWLFLIVLVAVWIDFGRPIGDLGFVVSGGVGFWSMVLLCVAVIGWMIYTLRRVARASASEKAKNADALGHLSIFVPHTKRELHNFYGVSITAGIVEEVVYRGFLIWYLGQYMPIWAAIIVSSIGFGLGHSYQGVSGVLRVSLVGLGFGTLYVISGSIWLPIVAHALLDMLQGAAIHEILRDDDRRPKPEPA